MDTKTDGTPTVETADGEYFKVRNLTIGGTGCDWWGFSLRGERHGEFAVMVSARIGGRDYLFPAFQWTDNGTRRDDGGWSDAETHEAWIAGFRGDTLALATAVAAAAATTVEWNRDSGLNPDGSEIAVDHGEA